MRVDAQPAFLLHTRPYRDSSLLVDFLTAEYGRVSAVAKGVRGTGKSATQRRGYLQIFSPLYIGWSGRGDLKTLRAFEPRSQAFRLQGHRLFSGMYLNELLIRLLSQGHDDQMAIFSLYEWVLGALAQEDNLDAVLRHFELSLLRELGYGIDLASEADSHAPIEPHACYHYVPGFGLRRADRVAGRDVYRGDILLRIASGCIDVDTAPTAKRLCRQALAPHLGDRPLRSRELFVRAGEGGQV